MKTISPALQALLATNQFYYADLYTFTLISGNILRLTSADVDIVSGGNTFSSQGPLIERSKISWKIGVAVDELDLTVTPLPGDSADGYPILEAVQYGVFDAANLQLERAFMPTWGDTSAGTVIMFVGWIAAVDAGGIKIAMKVESHLNILTIQMPRNMYCPTCWWNLYDQGCQVAQSSYTFSGTVGSNPTNVFVPVNGVSQANDYFDQGYMSLQSGLIRRSIKTWSGNVITPLVPLPPLWIPNPGDPVTLVAGCDHTIDRCQTKFNNVINFRGQPFIPVPETAL
jgi:uncharacterized phage protein (TIGR02218 family)